MSLSFPLQNTLSIALLGSILIYSYYYLSKQYPSIIEALWGTIKGQTRQFYFYSIGFCFICYIFIFMYIFSRKWIQNDISQITIAISSMIISSMLWMPLSIQYHLQKDKQIKDLLRILIIFVLLVVALSALYLVLILWKIRDNGLMYKLALLGSMYFFFQVFVLDFIYWNYAYLA
jgi:hypothetical protein